MRLITFTGLPLLLLVFGSVTGEPPAYPVVQENAAQSRRVLRPEGFPTDRPYSFGVFAGDTVYLAAQLGRDPVTGQQPEGIGPQTRQAMDNLGQVLKAAGMDYRNLVKCHVYLDSMDDYKGMNEVYGSFFGERVPARTTVEAERLPDGAGVQIGCVAYRDLSRISVVRPPDGSLPAPLGPYSAAVWAGNTLYLSGMGGQFPKDRRLAEGLGPQVAQTLVNIRTTLDAAGLEFRHVVSSHVYVTVREAGAIEAAYVPRFESLPAPPRTVVFLPRLPGAIETEITFVASRAGDRRVLAADDRAAGGSRGFLVEGVLYTRAESAEDAGADIETQLRGTFRRLQSTLQAAGLGWPQVAHVQISLASLADMPALDALFRETFPADPPARTVIQAIPEGTRQVQVSLVAVQ